MSRNSGIVAIVEGDGDRKVVPGLVRRILQQCGRYDLQVVARAIVTNGKPSLRRKFKHHVQYALNYKCTAILVLLDADDECPRTEVGDLVLKAKALNLNVPVAIRLRQM